MYILNILMWHMGTFAQCYRGVNEPVSFGIQGVQLHVLYKTRPFVKTHNNTFRI